jgi:hypothetical protein
MKKPGKKRLRRRIDTALRMLELAERKVSDNPSNGPGCPDVPGLLELRTAMLVLRTGDGS